MAPRSLDHLPRKGSGNGKAQPTAMVFVSGAMREEHRRDTPDLRILIAPQLLLKPAVQDQHGQAVG